MFWLLQMVNDPCLSTKLGRKLIEGPDALSQLTGRGINLAKRANPPTPQDFEDFFKTLADKSGSMVFWSGVGDQPARAFARANNRNTLEMLIGDKWTEFQKPKSDGGVWDSWEDAIAGFWDLASKACANFASGEVYVYMTEEVMDDQTRPTCGKCWYREEKPALIAGLGTGRVTRVPKYRSPWTPGQPSVGDITRMDNKIRSNLPTPRGGSQ